MFLIKDLAHKELIHLPDISVQDAKYSFSMTF